MDWKTHCFSNQNLSDDRTPNCLEHDVFLLLLILKFKPIEAVITNKCERSPFSNYDLTLCVLVLLPSLEILCVNK